MDLIGFWSHSGRKLEMSYDHIILEIIYYGCAHGRAQMATTSNGTVIIKAR